MQDRFLHTNQVPKSPAPAFRPLTRRALLLGLPLLASASLLATPAPAATYLVESLRQYQAALADLAQSKAVALVDVGAEWCAFCKVIDTKILPDERVAELMQSYGLIRIDVTAMTDGHRALLRHLRVDGPPTIFIVDAASGREHDNTRSVGDFSTENLIARLKPFAGR